MQHQNLYISSKILQRMALDKKLLKDIIGRMVVTKEGKRLGQVKDISFETNTGELIQLLLKEPTPYTRNLNLEISQQKEPIIPYNSIIAIGDFIVVSEEDLM